MSLLFSCQQEVKMKCKVQSIHPLKEIPSASGIERVGQTYFAIGDNSPWFYAMDTSFTLIRKVALGAYPVADDGLIAKAVKHDFEAMTEISWRGKSYVLILGSGSKQPHRFEGKLVDTEHIDSIRTFSLEKFYSKVRHKVKLQHYELNIEAAATVNGKLYIFNRGKNSLVVMHVDDFMEFILEEKEHLKMKAYTIQLPKLNQIQSGFSGAVGDHAHKRIIFTASVENTADWVLDGDILGSFIGVLEIEKIDQDYAPQTVKLIGPNGQAKYKAESIALVQNQRNSLDCVLVTDNDGGISQCIKVRLDLD
jgi:hypothetical protein